MSMTDVEVLLDSLVRVLSTAIDARSPYNANHTNNMARYAKNFISWLNAEGKETFDEERERQFLMSIWLHDIGKLVVPLGVMNKDSRLGLKLDGIIDRLQRFRMQAEIDFLRKDVDACEYEARLVEIEYAGRLIENANKAWVLTEEDLAELSVLGKKNIHGPDGMESYLTPDELISISVRKGTLTDDERQIMESHVLMTRLMLSKVKFPKSYSSVPIWATAHHEYLNGEGYPDGISAETIPIEVRMLTILDIFDALTAADRPYKPATPIDETFAVLTDMAANGKIDGHILELFRQSESWKVF